MIWVNFLHIYQPPFQSDKVLEEVVNESYRPLFRGLSGLPGIKINLNISGGLTQMLEEKGYGDVLREIRVLAETGRLEFTETAKYHPLLPFLSREEILSQTRENHKTNKRVFGEAYDPVCYFPPEMAYDPKVGRIVAETDQKMILLDQTAYKGGKEEPPRDRLLTLEGEEVFLVFREERVSNAIMSAVVRSEKEFTSLLKGLEEETYLCTAMDGETFGHHRPGLEETLFQLLSSPEPEQVFLSELPGRLPKGESLRPVRSSWASSREDTRQGAQFYSWRDPENEIHTLQWKMVDLLEEVARRNSLPEKKRETVSRAFASDQFFWASGEPWWSIEMIEKGAWMVLSALKSLSRARETEIGKAQRLYKEILSTTFSYQRSGKVEQKAEKYQNRVRIPFKERTLEKGKPEVYRAFVHKMKEKMWAAAWNENFEKAILWRDAVWKIENKNDVYDALHAIDLLRSGVSDRELTELMDRYKEEYKKIKPGQPEKRGI